MALSFESFCQVDSYDQLHFARPSSATSRLSKSEKILDTKRMSTGIFYVFICFRVSVLLFVYAHWGCIEKHAGSVVVVVAMMEEETRRRRMYFCLYMLTGIVLKNTLGLS